MKSIATYIALSLLILTLIGCSERVYHLEEENNNASFYENVNDSYSDTINKIDLVYPRFERFLDDYENTVKRYANRYGFDWQFILAVVNQESSFRTRVVSSQGAYGLMQIMPGTGRDITAKLLIDNVSQPENNIAGGVYYLWQLYTMFQPDEEKFISFADETDRLKIALAAYNGGPTRVRNAQQLALYLNLDPYQWVNIKYLLPMFSPGYSTLHQYVWETGRPPGGYFYGWHETINYVERVMENYSYYLFHFD